MFLLKLANTEIVIEGDVSPVMAAVIQGYQKANKENLSQIRNPWLEMQSQ